MKCKDCTYYIDKYCRYFKREIKKKKSCFMYQEKISSAVKNSFKFLNERGWGVMCVKNKKLPSGH